MAMGAIFMAGCVALIVFLAGGHWGLQQSHRFVFHIAQPPPFLSEDLAISNAVEALRQKGLSRKSWAPRPDARTSAPTGEPDRFLARNLVNPNRGVLLFVDSTGTNAYLVNVELIHTSLVCTVVRGK